MTGLSGHLRTADLRGYGRLAEAATLGIADVVEHLQRDIWRSLGRIGGGGLPAAAETVGGWVFAAIRGLARVAGVAGGGFEAALELVPPSVPGASSAEREAVLAVLNGIAGEHLAATTNPLAISLALRRDGQVLELDPAPLAAALPEATGKVLLLVHGLCRNDLQWRRNGHDHGAALAADAGFTPVYLHYNSGLHVSVNGRALAGHLETLLAAWPVPVQELAILGHSMGGLVARSACHYGTVAGHAWPRRLRSLVFLGTPHHGAPLERGGSWVDALLEASPYTTALARLGKVRSAGITDLRHGSLLDEDWQGGDRFARGRDGRRPVPLPDGVRCGAIGASVTRLAGHPGKRLLGDGLVPLDSALGRHRNPRLDLAIPESRRWVAHGLHHVDLLDDPDVYARIRNWLEEIPLSH